MATTEPLTTTRIRVEDLRWLKRRQLAIADRGGKWMTMSDILHVLIETVVKAETEGEWINVSPAKEAREIREGDKVITGGETHEVLEVRDFGNRISIRTDEGEGRYDPSTVMQVAGE